MAKSPEEMEAAMVANFAEKTGKPLDAWVKLARASGLARHGEIVKMLKTDHGMGHGFANLVAARTLAGDAPPPSGDALLDAQYAGGKSALRPIYDALIAAVQAFGNDVEASPKKAYVSLRRSKQFALIQPSTATRVDVGINLKDVAPTARLEASGSFNAMVSHRVRIEAVAQVDKQLVGWLRQAYESA